MRTSKITLKRDKYFSHQYEFLQNKPKARIKCLVGGFGSGKTFSFLKCTFINMIKKRNDQGKSNGLILYPTYSLAEEVFVEPFKDMLERNGVGYTYNIAAHKFRTSYGDIKIYQTRVPQRIVGASYTYCGIDELDVESYKNCDIAVNKALGRLRGCEDAELYMTTTPEGFHYTHHLMVEQDGPDKLLVHGKTTDNTYLPESYIQSLRDNYDDNLLKAYLDGEFTNLQKGSTYAFSRDKNLKECTYNPNKSIRVGIDFNADPMCAVVWQKSPSSPNIQVIDEFSLSHGGDGDLLTRRMCESIKQKYPNRKYIAYPDATGSARHSSSRFSDIQIIQKSGFQVKVKHINPLVVNRVNSMNNNLNKGNLVIDPKCKNLIKDLEQVVNKDGTRDIDKSNKNLTHLTDALGYAVDWEYPTVKPFIGTTDR